MVKLDYSHKPPTEQFKPGKPLSLSKRLPLPVNPLKQQQQDKWRLWLTILWLSLCLTHCLLVGGLLHLEPRILQPVLVLGGHAVCVPSY